MSAKAVAVIGAGPSGLATTKELLAEGHRVVCFEARSGLGGVFRFSPAPDVCGVWETCRLTSSELVTSFSDHFPGTRQGRPFEHRQLSHREYVAYLTSYAERFGLLDHLRVDHEVTAVARAGDGWSVTVEPVGGAPRVERFDAVAVCSGVHRVPRVPDIPGLDRFAGQTLHAAYYKGPESVEGRSALFIGAGESGGDVIGELSRSLDRAYVSLRRGVFVLPRMLHGVPNDYTGTRLLYSLPEFVSRRSDPEARRLRHRLARRLRPLAVAREAVDRLDRRVRERRRPAADEQALAPAVLKLIERLRTTAGGNQFETFATKTESFVEAVVEGRCTLRPGVREILPSGVVFADGTEEQVDTIVLCTGFEPPSAPFLDADVALERLYRSCVDPAIGPSLAFVGFLRPPLGAIPPMAEMQARWLARLLSGSAVLPTRATMETEIDDVIARRRRYHHSVYERLPTLVDFSTYLDGLADLIGCKPRLIDLVRSPRLLYKIYTAPFSGVQYRLRGPGADPALARAVLGHAPSHVRVVRFFDLAAAELARVARRPALQPHLTLTGRLDRRHDRVA